MRCLVFSLPFCCQGPSFGMGLLSYKEKSEKVVEGSASLSHLVYWKERNRIVFEDLPFSYTSLRNSFISSFSIWAVAFLIWETMLLLEFLCIL